MRRIDWALFLGLVITVVLSSFFSFAQQCESIAGSTLRLHILASSNSEADQQIKYSVRDALLEQCAELFEGSAELAAAQAQAVATMGKIEATVADTLAAHGCSDGFSVELTEMFFPTRHYDGFDLPAGRYSALRIVLGEGEGENWWCMLFPPMCIPAATAGESDLEQLILSLKDTPVYEPKLALVEFIESFKALQEGTQN